MQHDGGGIAARRMLEQLIAAEQQTNRMAAN
jgi:hypothetical protein